MITSFCLAVCENFSRGNQDKQFYKILKTYNQLQKTEDLEVYQFKKPKKFW